MELDAAVTYTYRKYIYRHKDGGGGRLVNIKQHSQKETCWTPCPFLSSLFPFSLLSTWKSTVHIVTKVFRVGVTGRLKEVDGPGSRRKASCLASRNRIRPGRRRSLTTCGVNALPSRASLSVRLRWYTLMSRQGLCCFCGGVQQVAPCCSSRARLCYVVLPTQQEKASIVSALHEMRTRRRATWLLKES